MNTKAQLLLATLAPLALFSPSSLAAEETAEITFNIQSDSAGGGMGKHWTIWQFNDPTCETKEKGERIAKKRRNKPIAPVTVPAGRPITLAFWYIEANFAQNRECSYTWTFTPVTGAKYTADLAVSPTISCKASLADSSGQAIPSSQPVNSCVAGLYGHKIANGEPAVITYRATIY